MITRHLSQGGVLRSQCHQYSTHSTSQPIIRISNGTFYRHHPNSTYGASGSNPALFENLTFNLPSFSSKPEFWSIIGPSSSGKTTLLQILRDQQLCIPAAARSYPFLETVLEPGKQRRAPTQAIKYVGFDGEQGLGAQAPKGAYLSARYESRREDTDFSVMDYLTGNTELNPSRDPKYDGVDPNTLARVIKDLRLAELIDMSVSNLSNGQTRRARIARALLGNPEVLLLDEPFMGLDPPTLLTLSPTLHGLAKANAPRLVLSLRPQDPIPDWITHLIFLKGNCNIAFHGPKEDVLRDLRKYVGDIKEEKIEIDLHMPLYSMHEVGRTITPDGIIEPRSDNAIIENSASQVFPQNGEEKIAFDRSRAIQQNASDIDATESASSRSESLSRDGYLLNDSSVPDTGEVLVEMQGARVAYRSKAVLGDWKQEVDGELKEGLWWNVKRGERWGIFGPNGSGKTTLLSLICSDHPQTYSLPIRLFGRSRIPEPGQMGISIFEIQAQIGHSSPEIHNHMPRSLTLRQILENAWSDTLRGVPKLDAAAREKVDACLSWFEEDLRPGASSTRTNTTEKANTSWADDVLFGGLPFSGQRVALFLRAVIKHPSMIILDEAFSGMDDGVRDRCLLFLAHGETRTFSYTSSPPNSLPGKETSIVKQRTITESEICKKGLVKVSGLGEDQALLCISHIREEIPGSIREWICLPEPNEGRPARFGRLDGPIEGKYKRWNEIWDM